MEKNISRYEDMIYTTRPVSRHIPMGILHRAMIFAPFTPLEGYKKKLKEKEIIYMERPVLSEETKELLDRKLRLMEKGMMVLVSYFTEENPDEEEGICQEAEGKVRNVGRDFIDVDYTKIPISDILDIRGEMFECLDQPW